MVAWRSAIAVGACTVALVGCGNSRPHPVARHPVYVRCDGRRWNAGVLIGMKLRDAQRLAERAGCTVRPIVVDGRGVPITTEALRGRINIAVRDGIVTELVSAS